MGNAALRSDSANVGGMGNQRADTAGVLPEARNPGDDIRLLAARTCKPAARGEGRVGSDGTCGAELHVAARQRTADRMLVVGRGRVGAPDPHRRKRVMFGLGLATKIYIAVEAVDMPRASKACTAGAGPVGP